MNADQLRADAQWQRRRANELDDMARDRLRRAEGRSNDEFAEGQAKSWRAEADMRRGLANDREDEARALDRKAGW